MKLTEKILHGLEALHRGGAATEEGAPQFAGVAQPATAPANGVQGHRGKVYSQRTQFLPHGLTLPLACAPQACAGLFQAHTTPRHQNPQVFAQ